MASNGDHLLGRIAQCLVQRSMAITCILVVLACSPTGARTVTQYSDTERLEWLINDMRLVDIYNTLPDIPGVADRNLHAIRRAIDMRIDDERGVSIRGARP